MDAVHSTSSMTPFFSPSLLLLELNKKRERLFSIAAPSVLLSQLQKIRTCVRKRSLCAIKFFSRAVVFPSSCRWGVERNAADRSPGDARSRGRRTRFHRPQDQPIKMGTKRMSACFYTDRGDFFSGRRCRKNTILADGPPLPTWHRKKFFKNNACFFSQCLVIEATVHASVRR